MQKTIKLIVEDSGNEEKEIDFPIFTTDSLETIKNRYFQETFTIPPIGVFEIIKKENEIFEAKQQLIKKIDKEVYSKPTEIVFKYDKDWEVNPLEDSIVRLISFRDIVKKVDILDNCLEESTFNYYFSKLCIECKKIFSIEDQTTVLLNLIMSQFATTSDVSYEESWSGLNEDYDFFGLASKAKDQENSYKRYFNSVIKDFGEKQFEKSQKERQDFEKFLVNLNKENLSDLKSVTAENTVKTDLVQTDYIYTGKCTLEYDGYEIFNLIKPDNFVSFLNIGKFYKLLNNFNYSSEFLNVIDEADDSILRLYIFGKPTEDDVNILNPDPNDYFLVELIQVSENKGLFNFELLIQSSKQIQLSEEEIINRAITSLSFIKNNELLVPTNIELKKTFGRGFYVYKNLNIPRELLFDFSTNNRHVSKVLIFDEKYKIEKERGEPRFYITLNNLESSIKCSINYKVVKKKSEPEIIAFPSEISVNDSIITITVLSASNQGEMTRLIDYFDKIIVYVLKHKKEFIEYYGEYITNIESLLKEKKKEEKQLNVSDINPDLFIPTYARFCQPSPIIIDDEKLIKELKSNPDKLMLFPKTSFEGTQHYYNCDHRGTANFVGLKVNKLENSSKYPFVPCCYKTSQLRPGRPRYNYEKDIQESEEKKTFIQVIESSKKILYSDQYGSVPSDIQVLLSSIDENILTGNYRLLRRGVPKGINSAINAMIIAGGYSVSEKNIEKIRSSIKDLAYYNLASQRGLLPNDVIKTLNNKTNIDPVLFLEILENIFEKNIIVFCNTDFKTERDQNLGGSLCDYKSSGVKSNKFNYKLLYSSHKFSFQNTVLLLRTYGSEFDALPFPHTELIGIEESPISKTTVNKLVKNVKVLFNTSSNFIKNIINIYSENVSHELNYLNLKSKVVGQIEDSYGKIRTVFVNYKNVETGKNELINLLVSPISNFIKKEFLLKKDVEYSTSGDGQLIEVPFYPSQEISDNSQSSSTVRQIDIETAIEFFTAESIKNVKRVDINDTIVGMIGELKHNPTSQSDELRSSERRDDPTLVYIPVKINNSISQTPIFKSYPKYNLQNTEYPYPNSLSFSLLQQYNEFKKLSNFVISYALFLFSNLESEQLEFIQYTSISDTYDDNIRELINSFNERIIVQDFDPEKTYKLNRNLNINNESIIKNQSLLIVNSERIKRKILYILYINSKYNINETINYKYKKYVIDYYTSVKDFDIDEHYSLFYTKQELIFSKIPPNNYNIINTVSTLLDTVFYFKNDSVLDGQLCILQKCQSLDHALYITNEWNKTNINIESVTQENKVIDSSQINYTAYIYRGNNVYEPKFIINNKTPETVTTLNVLITKFEKIPSFFYYAVLPIINQKQINKIYFEIDNKQSSQTQDEIEFYVD